MSVVETRFAQYLYNEVPAWALSDKPGFSYYAFVPEDLPTSRGPIAVLTIVHDTERRAETCRNAFADLAAEYNCVALAPLFPCGVIDPHDIDNYKRISYRGVRYDELLLQMVDELADRHNLNLGPLLLHGFSGGGQFAHRFFYLHPDRLAAVSIGAPGAVTLVDDTRDWWVGTRNINELFGTTIDEPSMRSVRVQTIIGSDDYGSEEVTVPRSSQHWMPDANHAGEDRQQRLEAVRDRLRGLDIAVEHVVVPEARHNWSPLVPDVKKFFADVLEERRTRQSAH